MSPETALQTTSSKSPSDELQECLTSIHESSRIATEINALESKLSSLSSIKQTLITGDNISTTNLDQLNKTISEVQANVDSKRREMVESEHFVINSFLNVMNGVGKKAERKADSLLASVTHSLDSFSNLLRTELKEAYVKTEQSLNELEKTKMNVADKEALVKRMEEFKANIVQLQKEAMHRVMEGSTEFMKAMSSRVESLCSQIDPEMISTSVTRTVMSNLDSKLKDQLDIVQKHHEATKTTMDGIPEVIEKLVRSELSQQIIPTNIQEIIKSLPEYEMMQKAGQQIANTSSSNNAEFLNMPNLEAIKQSVLSLSNQLTELKQSNEHTQTLVNSMRSHNLPIAANNSNPSNYDHKAAVKRMEQMEKEVKFIHNNIKMIETVVSMKSKDLEDQESTAVTVGRKRPRSDSTSTDVAIPNNNNSNNINSEYLSRLADIENKHQKLLDFIVQCKDSVLDDHFPTRLEAAMSKIEQVLMNHEKFIAFLVDPFTTTKKLQKAAISTDAAAEVTLNPAMIDAILQLVKRTAEEIALPLQNKIKMLEDKLEARSS